MFRDVNQDMGTRVWTKAYVNQEIEQVRTELKESLEERQKKRRLSELEHSAVKQARCCAQILRMSANNFLGGTTFFSEAQHGLYKQVWNNLTDQLWIQWTSISLSCNSDTISSHFT